MLLFTLALRAGSLAGGSIVCWQRTTGGTGTVGDKETVVSAGNGNAEMSDYLLGIQEMKKSWRVQGGAANDVGLLVRVFTRGGRGVEREESDRDRE